MSTRDYPITPIPFTDVRLTGGLWAGRIETNRAKTIPYCFRKCEGTGRIANFARAAGLEDGPHEGLWFNDSDVFKVIEGASYSLALTPDSDLDAYLDRLIETIAAAQGSDGYLFTERTIDADHCRDSIGDTRWSNLKVGHELYNIGHLYEAAVAHHLATGQRSLLDVAVRNADLVCRVFSAGGMDGVPGHEEIEIGLVKLYRLTGQRKYLDQARWFLDRRGQPDREHPGGVYTQDHLPVVEQDEAVGHAVRAGYLYAAMTDIAALTGDASYAGAIAALWENVVSRKMYLTGGIGSRHEQEAFGENYELPDLTAYNETCAAIAHALWQHRLFLLTGDARYADVLERILYNGFLAGVSLSGTEFFYPNPLSSGTEFAFNKGMTVRSEWFDCACCPSNIVRFIPSVPGMFYAQRDERIYVSLYGSGTAAVTVGDTPVVLEQQTIYPWNGAVRITVAPEQALRFVLALRIPGWARGVPVPSDLYRYENGDVSPWQCALNGELLSVPLVDGFALIEREWRAGDSIDLTLPMPAQRVTAHPAVTDHHGLVAIERGPLVYCFEGIDNGGSVAEIVVPRSSAIDVEQQRDLLGGVAVLKTGEAGAIPYFAWSHRGAGEMAVWVRQG